jgi:hypothetical protein
MSDQRLFVAIQSDDVAVRNAHHLVRKLDLRLRGHLCHECQNKNVTWSAGQNDAASATQILADVAHLEAIQATAPE